MKLLMTIEVECDNCYSPEITELDWLINDILLNPEDQLILHSNDIGDEIGTVKVLTAKAMP